MVRVIATMKAVNMIDQHIPETQIILGERSSLHQNPRPRIRVRKIVRARAQKPLRQKVISKLEAESRWRITTPAVLQRKATKIIRDTARECDICDSSFTKKSVKFGNLNVSLDYVKVLSVF